MNIRYSNSFAIHPRCWLPKIRTILWICKSYVQNNVVLFFGHSVHPLDKNSITIVRRSPSHDKIDRDHIVIMTTLCTRCTWHRDDEMGQDHCSLGLANKSLSLSTHDTTLLHSTTLQTTSYTCMSETNKLPMPWRSWLGDRKSLENLPFQTWCYLGNVKVPYSSLHGGHLNSTEAVGGITSCHWIMNLWCTNNDARPTITFRNFRVTTLQALCNFLTFPSLFTALLLMLPTSRILCYYHATKYWCSHTDCLSLCLIMVLKM